MPPELLDYLNHVDSCYLRDLKLIPLFNTCEWDKQRQHHFAATFYHLRGHFVDFMWYIVNFCTNQSIKQIITENLLEEIGSKNLLSHEMLYEQFTNECGVNIHEEIIKETHYYSFAKEYNKQHIRWLSEHDLDEQIAAFSAYERLDNLDYPSLLKLVSHFQMSPKALMFFNVHAQVQHFNNTLTALLPLWESSPEKIKTGFNFIYQHQLNMWEQLSNIILPNK